MLWSRVQRTLPRLRQGEVLSFFRCRQTCRGFGLKGLQGLRGISAVSSGTHHGLPIVYHEGVFQRIHDLLLHDGVISVNQVHDKEYLQCFNGGSLDTERMRRIGFGEVTREPVLVARTKAEVAGTLYTARLALRHGLAVNCAGGTHHAFPAHGSGYCILHDLAVTAEVLLAEGAVSRVLIFDLDVHQDGDRVVGDVLPRTLKDFKPDIVLYDAGVDIHRDDSLGRLSVTDDGLLRREYQVLDTCLAAGIPVAGFVGGGYSPDLDVLARRHCCLHRAAVDMWMDYELTMHNYMPVPG